MTSFPLFKIHLLRYYFLHTGKTLTILPLALEQSAWCVNISPVELVLCAVDILLKISFFWSVCHTWCTVVGFTWQTSVGLGVMLCLMRPATRLKHQQQPCGWNQPACNSNYPEHVPCYHNTIVTSAMQKTCGLKTW